MDQGNRKKQEVHIKQDLTKSIEDREEDGESDKVSKPEPEGILCISQQKYQIK